MGKLSVFREQRTETEAQSNPLAISGSYRACFVRSDCKRDNKEVYQAENCEIFEKPVKCNYKNNSRFKYTNNET